MNFPAYKALPTIAPSTPVATSVARAAMSSRDEIPPLAITGLLVTAHTDFKRSMFGPAKVPSFATSVTT